MENCSRSDATGLFNCGPGQSGKEERDPGCKTTAAAYSTG